ncbi:MAG: branched-chain amino acid ABC transporter permease [Burkholderiales bacterium]|nr:branched-chain amino acid ABC transporter permease [Burkholderiales bacterium]MDE2456608.1 branched-chain amino acid ABC transporter permease [Burkholderiales bacterium]
MKRDLATIAVFAALVAALAATSDSGVLLNAVMMTLYAALLAQAWNILGGWGGQMSFGHALFFGVGAYASAIAQVSHGWNAWAALAGAVAAAALAGLGVGALAFRYGLKGSYFALVTLAFAEVARIVAVSVGFTGGGVGMMLPLQQASGAVQSGSRHGFVGLVLGLVVVAQLVGAWLRHSRFGAQLQAVRDNEDAARALGVDPYRTKLGAIALSAAFTGAAGAFYLQVFQYIDSGIAFGVQVSVEALIGAIVGGLGSLWGPVLGAAVLHLLGESTRNLFGQLPGLNMVLYGALLVAIVTFMPRGLAGLGRTLREAWRGRRG